MPKVIPQYKEQAKTRIILNALKLFLENGYKKTTMSDIAAQLGISKAAIYQYFPTKEALLLGVFEHSMESRIDIFAKMTQEEVMKISSNQFFDKMLEGSFRSRAFSFEVLSEAIYNEKLTQKLRTQWEQGFQYLEDYFNSLKTKGIIKKTANSRALAIGIVALRHGLQGSMLLGVNPDDTRTTWVKITKILLDHILIQ